MRTGGTLICDRSSRPSALDSLFRPIFRVSISDATTTKYATASNGHQTGSSYLVIDPNDNLSGAIFEGLDYEAIYFWILRSLATAIMAG